MAFNLQRVRLTCSNCGVLGVKIDPCAYCQLLPQCRKCRRCMLGRCLAKSTRPNICETRSVRINRLIVSPIMHEQTNSFFCTTTSVYAVQNCDARKLRYKKLKSRTALEGTHEERELETLSGDIDFRTFLHRNAETIGKALADSLRKQGYI